MPNHSTLGPRAVVLGASMAGLLAARVLSERFDEVVLLERDALPDHAAPRKGTPHATHPHGLLARGREVLEELFPGFTQAMVDRGGVLGDLQHDIAFDAGGQRFADGTVGLPAIAVSRLAIEAEVRLRVLARHNVRAFTGFDVLAPALDTERRRVTAARYVQHAQDGRAQECRLEADLVVDCTGRGSRLPAWLQSWGYAAPEEERVEIGICYTSAYFKRSGEFALGAAIAKAGLISGVTPDRPRPGVLIAQEPDGDSGPRWVACVGGYRGDHAPATPQGMRQRAQEIGSPELIALAQGAERIGDVIRYHVPCSLRRRCERLARFPQRLLALGDALTSFNPIYGQGMTVASCQALALRDALAGGLDAGLHRRFFRAAARIVDTPWELAVGGDLALDAVPGPRPLAVRLVNAYIARLYRVAPHDALVSAAFLKVVHMIRPPASLFAPAILWRVLRHGGRRPGSVRAGQGRSPGYA
jgi:2-polyprenyl-6-methoxyphenol hydroxylase-like FAD-dependent oxidoreductase